MSFVVIIGPVRLVWFGSLKLDYVIATAMVIKLIFVGLAGKLMLVVFDRLVVDLALGSGAFVSTSNSVAGFYPFFSWAPSILL